MSTILRNHLVMAVYWIGSCNTEKQLLIFTRYHIFTEPTYFFNYLSLEHDHVWRAYEIASEQGCIMVRRRTAIMDVPRSFRTKQSIIPAYEAGIRMFLKSF